VFKERENKWLRGAIREAWRREYRWGVWWKKQWGTFRVEQQKKGLSNKSGRPFSGRGKRKTKRGRGHMEKVTAGKDFTKSNSNLNRPNHRGKHGIVPEGEIHWRRHSKSRRTLVEVLED